MGGGCPRSSTTAAGASPRSCLLRRHRGRTQGRAQGGMMTPGLDLRAGLGVTRVRVEAMGLDPWGPMGDPGGTMELTQMMVMMTLTRVRDPVRTRRDRWCRSRHRYRHL
jgi:hypothetical protein